LSTDPVPVPDPEPAPDPDPADEDDLTLSGVDVSGGPQAPTVPPVPPLRVEPLDTGMASEPGHAPDHEFEWDLIERASEPTTPPAEDVPIPPPEEPPEPGKAPQ